jgi:F-type H+-transporting ATPase subunit gamma
LPPVYLYHNKPSVGALYKCEQQYVSPFGDRWVKDMSHKKWSSSVLPEIIDNPELTLKSLVREYFFVSLYRACAESQASENASRMLAMQRAEKNIAGLLENLNKDYHLLRQDSIDEELFDVISGFEALNQNL